MSTIDQYLLTVTPAQKTEFERIRAIVKRVVPSMEEGTSYAMPAYLYKGKAFLGVLATKKYLSLYPFSGKTVAALGEKLADYEISAGSGSIHYSLEKPIPEMLVEEIITIRLGEIERSAKK